MDSADACDNGCDNECNNECDTGCDTAYIIMYIQLHGRVAGWTDARHGHLLLPHRGQIHGRLARRQPVRESEGGRERERHETESWP